jgi:hypothetical protein
MIPHALPVQAVVRPTSLLFALAVACVFTMARADDAVQVTLGKEEKPTVRLWLETSLHRIFPQTKPGSPRLTLLAPRNGTVSFQACVRNDRDYSMLIDGALNLVEGVKTQTRLVGLVPMAHLTPGTSPQELDGAGLLPGLVPDPLYPETKTRIGSQESRSYWITLKIPADVQPGERELRFRFYLGDNRQEVELPLTLKISEFVIKPRHDFPVTHWWRGEATWDYYQTGMFEDERWWKLTHDQLQDMFDHGSNVVYVPMFFNRRETFKRPCQLLVINEPSPGRYEFDWSNVKRFVDMCREIGFKEFEWPHMWIYWGVENPMRLYKKVDGAYVMLWPPDTKALSDTYVNFLKQFLPQFHTFLTEEDLLAGSYFHLSDEPGTGQHIENYKAARKLLKELAPWMKVMDALSDVQYGRQRLTDMPIPMVSAAQAYIDAKIPHWVYYCCSPTGPWLNRFMDTPLAKIRMSGWLFYKLRARGFLHWGFNYWHAMEQERAIDPFTNACGDLWPSIPYGDPFMIYPGVDEPIDSIRWEVFAESLQDFAILQTAAVSRDDAKLSSIKSYKDFPKAEKWITNTLSKILEDASQNSP